MKYVLFYFIAASQQFVLLQPSIQLQHFHARLAGGRDPQLSITPACCYTKTLNVSHFVLFTKLKYEENPNG